MADIATLGIKVTTDGVQQATQQLDQLNKAGAQTAQGAQKVADSSKTAAKGYEQAAISAKQLAAAQRQLPMQFTDIATGLASGQKPLQVLLQQGGQLKDTFGGVGPALRATGGYVAGLVSPFTLAAGAVLALGAAFVKGQQETVEYNKALILTGNIANLTAGNLADMASEMDDLAGVTTASAAAALTKVAASGRFAADEISQIATAAELMRVATGREIDETVKEFVRLREDPVQAILKLNDTYHFLTQSTFEQIKALQEQGRTVDAGTLAVETYANMLNDRLPKVTENVGWLEQAWRGVKGAAGEAWDAMLGIGRGATGTDLVANVDRLQGYLGDDMPRGMRMQIEQELKQAQARLRDYQRGLAVQMVDPSNPLVSDSAAIKAQEELIAGRDRLLATYDRQKALELEIGKIKADAKKYGLDELQTQKLITAAKERAAERDRKSKRKVALTEEQKAAKALAQSYESLTEQLGRQSTRLDEATHLARINYEIQSGALKGLSTDLQAVIREQARWTDWQQEMADIEKAWERSQQEATEARIKRQRDTTSSLTEFALQAARNMQDAFGQFFFDVLDRGFDGMVESFANALKRMAAEFASSQFLKMLSQALSGVQGDGWWATLARSVGTAMRPTPNALGGAYQSATLSAHSGTIVSKPTLFAFARGAGLMGEAGPEAILPLRRGGDGKLGVVAAGGGPAKVEVNIENNTGSQMSAETSSVRIDGDRLVVNIVAKAIRGGELDGPARQAWGLKRAGYASG
ncbi:MAG: phage tail tape measure protein [Pseudoxanthomonas sp.]|nr:phage tail tape measure protein [Pseudoxanthomonas sp.]